MDMPDAAGASATHVLAFAGVSASRLRITVGSAHQEEYAGPPCTALYITDSRLNDGTTLFNYSSCMHLEFRLTAVSKQLFPKFFVRSYDK
jgi:hypothetical protein